MIVDRLIIDDSGTAKNATMEYGPVDGVCILYVLGKGEIFFKHILTLEFIMMPIQKYALIG